MIWFMNPVILADSWRDPWSVIPGMKGHGVIRGP